MKPKIHLFLTYLFLLFSFFSKADHIIGGEMTYQCLGGGDYQIRLTLYRDCAGGGPSFDGPANGAISIYEGDSNTEFAKIIMPDPTVINLVPTTSNPCLIAPPNICVEQGIYEFNLSDVTVGGIDLPLSNESYFIVYQRCCRNSTISNILTPDETGATFFQEIKPEAQALCNNTPTFNDLTPIILCVNESFSFDHSATDIDGDELVYEFCSPLKGGGTAGWMTPGTSSDLDGTNPNPDAPAPFENVNFISPTFSPTNPMGGNILSIDEETGVLSGIPNTLGQFVVGVCVTEFRNGVILSRVQRDFHFNVQACAPLDFEANFIVNPDSNTVGLFHFENLSINANSYTWDFGDGATSILKDPSHTFSTSGIFTVTLTSYNDMCDVTDSISQEIVINVTDVKDLTNDFKVEIFPNPNQGVFNLKIENPITQEFQITVLDLYGKEVYNFSKNVPQGIKLESMNMNDLPQGIYFLKIKNSSKLLLKRVVVQ